MDSVSLYSIITDPVTGWPLLIKTDNGRPETPHMSCSLGYRKTKVVSVSYQCKLYSTTSYAKHICILAFGIESTQQVNYCYIIDMNS